jgi:CheY-like chemotaxis protein
VPADGQEAVVAGDGRRALVVAGAGPARAALEAALAADGYAVRAAPTAWEGLAAVLGWRPDLIVLDPAPPAIDGHALARAVRRDPVLARTPLLLLSAARAGERAVEAARLGAEAHLAKPVELAELLAVAARLAAGVPDKP